MDSPSEEIIKAAIKGSIKYPLNEEPSSLSSEEKKQAIAHHFREIMRILNLDLSDSSLEKTPERVAKMYIDEIFSGLEETNFPSISLISSPLNHPQIITTTVNYTSFCEHHFVPMEGTCEISYIPNQYVIGLSKIPRVVKYFAKRPQLQERLTQQIGDALSILLETQDLSVTLTAKHFCVVARGIESQGSTTTTTFKKGKFT